MAKQNNDGMVTVKLPRLNDGSPEVKVVGVNYKMYTIHRGVNVQVPKAVAEILRNSDVAAEVADTYIDKVVNK